ncbi:MAG: hypothetical protein ABH811_00770 [archaeon]
MGWINKTELKRKELPSSLPDLPELPEFPSLEKYEEQIPQLPSFPNNSFGDKFSQNTIKDAVTGRKEGDEVFDADEFAEEDAQMMQRPLIRSTKEEPSENSSRFKRITKESEPLFIRIDKFEESMDIFEKTKEKISTIEHLLRDIQNIRQQEEKELNSWAQEIQIVKQQIEKVDKELFSKL